MSDDQPGSGVTHTVTITIPAPTQGWNPTSWAQFKQAVKTLATTYQGQVTEMTFQSPKK
ncbi:MAG TPA: hypothetical protein VID04_15980 [Methylomirabilota bacterium]